MDISGLKGNKTMDISHVTNASSSVSSQLDYEVFLSFRGPDMHSGFADFLYTNLTDVGICVSRSKGELESGKEIDPQLIQAIEQSKVSIPVISKECASSKSCLWELDQMVKCKMGKKNHIIIPIFYYVDPSDVRNCGGPFAGALGEQEKHDRDDTLRCIGELEGHHLHEKNEGSHGEVVKQIVHQVQQKLKTQELIVTKQFVRDDCHVHCIMAKLKVDYCKGQAVKIGETSVTVLGMYGIPGVGKTVLAKYVYNQLYHLFDACSFLGEIQAEIKHPDSILSLQNKLISDLDKGNAGKFDSSEEPLRYIQKKFRTMKVLLLLDDVSDHGQLSTLVGELDWLGLGSRVILTSQTQDVLRNINGAESFVLEPMKQDEALKLFCRHAFGTDSPPEKFMDLSTEIVNATERLPLALQVIGSSLFLVKSKKAWRETLIALKVAPPKRVQAALEKSYNNLIEEEQQIFLDIACFFRKMDKRIPYYLWDDGNYSPSRLIQALIARSLIEIGEDKKLLMLKTLKKFGREIVKNENRNEPCRRSRLWNHREALDVLGRKEGTKNVKARELKFDDTSKRHTSFKCDQVDGLQNLMFVKLDSNNNPEDLGDNLSSLRWLHWQGDRTTFDFKSLTLKFQNLVILDFSGGRGRGDGRDWELPVEARQLKVLNLTGHYSLVSTPKFPASMELERLILEDCSGLANIQSIGNLEKLVSLNVKRCKALHELPDLGPMRGLKELLIDETSVSRIHFQKGSMTMLKTLSACKCKNLTDLSDQLPYLKSLKYLALDGAGIVTLGESIRSLEKLKRLSLRECRGLSNLPDDIGELRSLQFLDLSDTLIRELPPVKNLKDMKVLRMSRTSMHEFPEDILNLEKLEEIDFTSCQSLAGKIPDDIGRLSSLAILKLSDTRICGPLPPSISRLSRLREIHISGC